MRRSKRLLKKNAHRQGMQNILSSGSLRDTVGQALYDRVMLWNDSGAVEALHAAEQRREAKEKGKPCWVPKLRNDLYISPVDWDNEDNLELYDIPKSAVALAKQRPAVHRSLQFEDYEQALSGSPHANENKANDTWNDILLSRTVNKPFTVDAVLEDWGDGQRLLVGGFPVQPTGWGDSDAELHSQDGFSCSTTKNIPPTPVILCNSSENISQANEHLESAVAVPTIVNGSLSNAVSTQKPLDVAVIVDAILEGYGQENPVFLGSWSVDNSHCMLLNQPCIVDAVLEDYGEGQRLLVGGWPVQPSWDQLDTNWSQLGWDGNQLHHDGSLNVFDNWANGTNFSWSSGNLNTMFCQGYYLTAC